MKTIVKIFFLLFCETAFVSAQEIFIKGQASGWITGNADEPKSAQIGIRYVPEFSLTTKINEEFSFDGDVSLNGFSAEQFASTARPDNTTRIKLYRASLRLASNEFELRAGLQKINFGSAVIFRPLMWFDKIDARDPLQMTDGTFALLARRYFSNNTTAWLWVLFGNTETKGWEISATEKNSVEFGGRFQQPLFAGEAGITFHRRSADFNTDSALKKFFNKKIVPENKFAIDGKWDIGIGVWCEAAITQTETDIAGIRFARQWTLGADNTFDIGNGLYVVTEFFRSENGGKVFETNRAASFSAVSVNYPLNILDKISCFIYRDWKNNEWYRVASFQRTYDNWSFYILGFWNPAAIPISQQQNKRGVFAGNGAQIMAVYNH